MILKNNIKRPFAFNRLLCKAMIPAVLLTGAGYSHASDVAAKATSHNKVMKGEKAGNAGDVKNESSYVLFESGQVRPLALSADGSRLFAVNTPDNHLEIYDVTDKGLSHVSSVPVGMEPVAVAVKSDSEVWVVNHLSDSVSIVDLTLPVPAVKKTLLVGDEPRDIVFAGPNKDKAFITAAHRGQNAPFDPQLQTPGIGRADVWVFDSTKLGDDLGGTPQTIINLFSDTPRALAVSPDGSKVYAAAFQSGNQTTTLKAEMLKGGLDKAAPHVDIKGNEQPKTGLIVKYVDGNWVDNGDPLTKAAPKTWNDRVRFSLPDKDVFVIDAMAKTPKEIESISHVGTTLFNMVVNPKSGNVYVSNTDARNHVRFASSGDRSDTLRGHFVENQITLISGDKVKPLNLNKHITSYNEKLGTQAENYSSLSQPMEMVISKDGAKLYVAAYGSSKIGVFNTKQLEDDSFVPNGDDYIKLTGGGPSGIILDEGRNKLYTLTRFDNAIAEVNLATGKETAKVFMPNPEPESVTKGRPFLYDAALTSSRGDSACGSCHVFGDMDHLAWDLGDPDAAVAESPNTYLGVGPKSEIKDFFHPMKGPMVTQSLRGLPGQGPMHWRGDRTGASRDEDETIEEQAFEDFNIAFVDLQGRAEELTEEEMQRLTDFAMQLEYPPNPIRALDNSLTEKQHAGFKEYNIGAQIDQGIVDCNTCHQIDPAAKRYGTVGLMNMSVADTGRAEDFKIPHLRALYQKVGMFGSTGDAENGEEHKGDQIRGFGFNHDGASQTVYEVLSEDIFEFNSEEEKRNVEIFSYMINSKLNPIVGQQMTLNKGNYGDKVVQERIDLLVSRAKIEKPVPECDLIVKGVIGGEARGGLMQSNGLFKLDSMSDSLISDKKLRKLAKQDGNHLTYTCVPPGSGLRMGLDRNEDGHFDRDEVARVAKAGGAK